MPYTHGPSLIRFVMVWGLHCGTGYLAVIGDALASAGMYVVMLLKHVILKKNSTHLILITCADTQPFIDAAGESLSGLGVEIVALRAIAMAVAGTVGMVIGSYRMTQIQGAFAPKDGKKS